MLQSYFIMLTFCYVDDWKCDQYRWVNQGVTKLPRAKPVLRKMYFSLDSPEGPSQEFQRYAYQLLSNMSVTLIQYLGDEKAVIHFPHGNMKFHMGKKAYSDVPIVLEYM